MPLPATTGRPRSSCQATTRTFAMRRPSLKILGPRSRRCRTRRAQVVDVERDRLRHPLAPAFVEEVEQRRQLEEGAERTTVHGGEAGVADDLPPERQDALERAVAALDLDAEKARVGDGLDDLLHWPSAFCARVRLSNALSARLAPSMNVPSALAKGSSGVRSHATARMNATLRARR